MAKRGVDLSISVVGLQVNERVRKQLECIARVGGGSYVDVQDAGKLGEELAALLSRAFRSYEPAGTEVQGGPDAATGPGIGAGLFQDVIAPGEQRWYALDVPEGKRAVVSVTAIPPHDSTGYGGLETKLLGPDQQQVASQSFILHGGLPPGRFGTTESQSVRSAPDGPPGRYALSVAIDNPGQLSATEIPLEIGVQYLAPGEEVGLTRNPGELATPTPTPTATPTAVRGRAAARGRGFRPRRLARRAGRGRARPGARVRRRRRVGTQEPGVKLALVLARVLRPGRTRERPGRPHPGRRRRLVQRRADPRAGQLPRHDPPGRVPLLRLPRRRRPDPARDREHDAHGRRPARPRRAVRVGQHPLAHPRAALVLQRLDGPLLAAERRQRRDRADRDRGPRPRRMRRRRAPGPAPASTSSPSTPSPASRSRGARRSRSASRSTCRAPSSRWRRRPPRRRRRPRRPRVPRRSRPRTRAGRSRRSRPGSASAACCSA